MNPHGRATLSYVDVLLYMADMFSAISTMYLLREHQAVNSATFGATDTHSKITTQTQHMMVDDFLCCSKVG